MCRAVQKPLLSVYHATNIHRRIYTEGGSLPMAKDMLFFEKRGEISDFDFGKDTAVVFDDMLDRFRFTTKCNV
jgi:hypothetical protein